MMSLGNALSQEDQQYALRKYCHRYTGTHRPHWSSRLMKNGKSYPVQFLDDIDWLNNTLFYVNKDGRIDKRAQDCISYPTFPHNPELHGKYGEIKAMQRLIVNTQLSIGK